jgi:hypothetical protein
MDALLFSTIALIVIVGTILISAGELGKGAEAGKGALTLVGLSIVAGYVVALASGSV